MIMNFPLEYVDEEEDEDIDKVSGLVKTDLCVWVKQEGIMRKLSYSQMTMKSNVGLIQS